MRFPVPVPRTRAVLVSLLVPGALVVPTSSLAAQDGAAGGALPAESGLPVGIQAPAPTADTVDPSLFGGLSFRFVGPSRGGRVTAVEGHPSHPHTFYQGATGGGVWKTTNYGMSWENISDGYFESPSIGHIEVADSDPNTIYVGTGSDGIRSNIIIGKGVYRSTDAGETWDHIGLEDAGQIGSVKAHPDNPDLVYAAAMGNPFKNNDTRGVYRSSNGGLDWERILFTSDSVGAVDLEFHPADPNVIYAGMWRAQRRPWSIISGSSEEDGIWKTEDGGDTWRRITAGLPDGLIGKVDFSVSADMPDRVHALVEAPEPIEGLYRSDDAGETWELINDDPRNQLMHRPFYFTNITADPMDGDVVYVMNLSTWKSTDGGRSFSTIPNVHGDDHDLWINPDDSRIMVHGSDGGGVVTLDGGQTWSPVNNQPTAELYQVDVDDRFPYWLYAGQQDDSYTVSVPSRQPSLSAPGGPDAYWRSPGGCETGPAVPKPGDPDIVYANCKGRFGVYNQRTGQEQQYYVGAVNIYGTNPANLPYRFQRVVPIEVSPHDPDLVFHGSQYVHRTTNGGRTWDQISPDLTAFRPDRQMVSGGPITRDATGEEHYSTLYVIEASPHDPDVIWTGANDGPVYVTLDGGESWENVTPPDMPAEGRMNSIDISRHDPDKVYVAGYRLLLGDFRPYVYRTEDAGETWTLLTDGTNGIPADFPVRVVREDPDREGLLYAGTEFGLFISFDDGATWQSFQLDLPVTPVTDIEVYRQDLALSTMGRGFWVLDDVTPLHEIDADGAVAASGPAHLFEGRPQYRTRTGRNSGYEWASNTARPQYPGSGADISYWISPDLGPDATVEIEILDAGGEVIRTYASGGGGAGRAGGPAMQRMAPRGGGRAMVSTTPGMHRLRWDLRAQGEGRGGPIVPPGRYTVRLAAGDATAETGLELRIDPRVAGEGVTVADLEEQYRFNLDVMETTAEAREVSNGIEGLRERLAEARADAGGGRNRTLDELAADLEELDAQVNDAEGSYPRPMLLSQLNYLGGMTSRADQAPGADAYARHEELQEEVRAVAEQLQALVRRLSTT
ncbi:VPS10 domain-containing protein [Candidatus Palauibacter sp.]|uniref:VPS10 domain-containing protein n=1 Tax=Candidatus Palauibacter sp. TaxID=3101350 RepID=UPI003B026673